MRERLHGLAAQPSTGAKSDRSPRAAGKPIDPVAPVNDKKSGRPGINPGARLFLVLLIIAGVEEGNWKWSARAAGFAAPAARLSHRFNRLAP